MFFVEPAKTDLRTENLSTLFGTLGASPFFALCLLRVKSGRDAVTGDVHGTPRTDEVDCAVPLRLISMAFGLMTTFSTNCRNELGVAQPVIAFRLLRRLAAAGR
jgi:hypothetical protein